MFVAGLAHAPAAALVLYIDPQLSRKLMRGGGRKGWLVHAWACVLR